MKGARRRRSARAAAAEADSLVASQGFVIREKQNETPPLSVNRLVAGVTSTS